jgi:thiamine pyrophosphate-dependent acetolactate synthase large subunit-like protein/nitrite reductase/ring-hydroxylating ferredoxin subunit
MGDTRGSDQAPLLAPIDPDAEAERRWVRIDPGDLAEGRVTIVVAENRALCVSRTAEGIGVLDNRCPHQGGPLGDGEIDENGNVICPWHGYEYDPVSGRPPAGFDDGATAYPVDEREDGVYVELPVRTERTTLMDQLVGTLVDWGVDTVFGMVGHSNLGLADALRKAEEAGAVRYVGIRHEGAAAFAASGYAKLTGRPAACFSIAGPGATNLLTGLYDAKVDRVPILALTGQVNSQVLGPGTFQEVDLAAAFGPVSEWSQTVLRPENATELAALAVKHAVVQRDVAHLIFPDEVQELPGIADPVERPRLGRVAEPQIAPPEAELERAVALLAGADNPVIIVGNGARPFRNEVLRLAEMIDAPVITTFKAKGAVPDDHPLSASVLGRSGTPIGSATMARADALLVLGASFSNHTGIATWVPTVQVDFDRMMLGKFHPVEVPLWGEIGRTVTLLCDRLEPVDRPTVRATLASRWERWRAEKRTRASAPDPGDRIHPAATFAALQQAIPDDAVIAVDVGNNTYAFGHYFECTGDQDVLMSGYLGSIGFALPAAMGAWTAVGDRRKVVSVSGDGGLGQYLAEVTTAVKYGMAITHVVLDNGELGKISKEQVGALRPVWQTGLVNPPFDEFARQCGAAGFRAEAADELDDALTAAMAVEDRPSLVAVRSSVRGI